MLELASGSQLKVLLIDDDEDDALITQDLLQQGSNQQFEFEWAPTYAIALERMEAREHDIGLLDYHLGTRTGLDLMNEAKAKNIHFPMIMLTGQGNENLVMKALELGVIDYIPKHSISSDNLQRAIRHSIEKVRLQSASELWQQQLEISNQQLREKNEEVQRFYHLVAHELKTPLTAAGEFVNILLEGIAGSLNPKQVEYLNVIHGCCAHLHRNIHDLYEITRLETGKLSVHMTEGSLPDLIHDVINVLSPKASTQNICIQASLAPNLPTVMLDAQRIRQVLLNLLGNALKFSDGGGNILVSACEDSLCPGRVRISVQDTGIGIPKQQLKKIFERLYQVQEDPTASSPGLGLGLFICRELIKLHEGTLSVTSTLGEGSTFSFTLRSA